MMEVNNSIKYLTFGSPLIDIIVDVEEEFINKHDLKMDTTIHSSGDNKIFRDVELHKPHYVAGGCSYNAIRVLNWIANEENDEGLVGCLGSVGKDYHGMLYEQMLQAEKIVPLFESFENSETGKCAVICKERDRCHITDLGASNLISGDYVDSVWEQIKNVKLVYTELYIMAHKNEIMFKLANLCLDADKLFGFNFPSTWFLDKFCEDILHIIEYGDVIFANKEEAKFFAKLLNIDFADISDLCESLAKLPKKNKKKVRVFIITCGPDPAFVTVFDPKTEKVIFSDSFEPLYVSKEDIVDTNGAGDSFAGGFLAYYCLGKSIENCMIAGHWAAKEIIKKRGCDIPFKDKPSEELRHLIDL